MSDAPYRLQRPCHHRNLNTGVHCGIQNATVTVEVEVFVSDGGERTGRESAGTWQILK